MIRTARRARKSAAGYDLTRLFVGSEGTLGVITEVTLAALRHPRGDLGRGLRRSRAWRRRSIPWSLTIQTGIPIARIELLDAKQMDAVNKYVEARLRRGADLVLRVPRHRGRRRRAGRAGEGDSPPSRAAPSSAGRPRPRSARNCGRRGTTPITRRWRCGRARKAGRPMSACRSRGLPNASPRPRTISTQSFVTAVLVGHVGDGNFHLVFILDPDKPEELVEAGRLNDRMVAARHRHGRHLHRRARHRLRQDGFPHRRAWRRRRGHAHASSARSTPTTS